ncbi:MAG TPA: VCBS repeat-containing protein, partial [Flavisolibacter sp.]|nr:VCBS repeat-containing protein [Flavisolibacter sp.]
MKPFLLIICNSLFSLTLLAQWNGFATFSRYPVSEPVNLFHIKDITGDGVADITTLYSAGHLKMGFLTAKGNGQFYAEQTVDKEENYFLSDMADLNGDGLTDMVSSSYWANGFKIFFGKGAGQFSEVVYVATGVHGRAVKCVDINKDGKTDIVSVTSGSGNTISLHVFIGKGDGSFFPKKTFPSVLDTSKDIFITDKNGDGLPDVAVSSSFPWLVIFYQTPEGNFVPGYVPTFTTARVNFHDF